MQMTRQRISAAVICFLLLCFVPKLWAEAPLNDAKAIMEHSYNRDDGKDCVFTLEMVLVDKAGGKRLRQLAIYSKDYDELIKTLIVFKSPADIEGTKFLSWENKGADDTQYLFLPALNRSRRIVSTQKKLQFVNTDFTYEDMQRRCPDKDTHALLKQEAHNGRMCYVVESVPVKKENSQYSKRISWVDQESFVVVRTEFFNKKGKLSKCFTVEALEKRQEIWTSVRTRMQDLEVKHETLLNILEVQYNQGIGDDVFTVRELEQK